MSKHDLTPIYIDEFWAEVLRNDGRYVKTGYHAMDDRGRLHGGRFSTEEACAQAAASSEDSEDQN